MARAKRKFNFDAADDIMKEEGSAVNEVNNTPASGKEKEEEPANKVQSLVEKIESPINTAFHFKYVPREKMVFHKNNDYPMESIDRLAERILEVGLIHNIEVMYDLENETYIIDSGERRTRAIDSLIEKYKNYEDTKNEKYQKYIKYVKPFEKGYPCKIITQGSNPEMDDIDAEIRLIIANEETREKDPARTKKHIDKLNELLGKKNSLAPKNKKINVNETIGEQLGISDRQVKKYKAIDKLIPELKEKFESSQITLTDGANYSKLTEEEQRQILNLIENGESKKEIRELYEQLNRMKAEVEKKDKEIAEKESEIQNLETAKKEAMESVNEIQKKAETLRSEIKKELEENDPNKGKITELEAKLNNANSEIEKQKKELDKTAKDQKKIIAELEAKLAEKEKKAEKNSELIKAEGKLENVLDIILRDILNLESAYKQVEKYEGIPEELDQKLVNIIDRLGMISKKKK